MEMSDSQPYYQKLCLAMYEKDINAYSFENCFISFCGFSTKSDLFIYAGGKHERLTHY